MDLLIHIGPHKTGTTAVQKALHDGRRKLRRAGVIYPKTNWYHFAQHRLAFAAKNRKAPGDSEIACLENELAQLKFFLRRHARHRGLLSSEEFFSAPTSGIEALRKGLADFNVKLICCLRRPDELLLSMHGQNALGTENGFTTTLDAFACKPRHAAPDIDYEACLTRWAEIFGWSSLDVAIYEHEPPLPRILSALDLPRDLLPDKPGVNRTQPKAVSDIMRLAKEHELSPYSQKKLRKMAISLFDGCPLATLTVEQRRHIIRTLEPANNRLFKKLGRANPYTLEQLRLNLPEAVRITP